MARLIIYEGSEETSTIYETFELSEARVLIGSDSENQLILQSPEVDPTHASLELRDHHWFLQDLGGPGGTAVNGQHIQGPYLLHNNDVIELGFVKMRFANEVRGVTREIPIDNGQATPDPDGPEYEEIDETASGAPPARGQPSGRLWFAGVASGTVLVIFGIVMVLVTAHMMGLINIGDLLPLGFGSG